MGYRTYIARLAKKEYEQIKGMTLEQLYKHKGLDLSNEMDSLGVYDVVDKSLYELGKYTEFDDEKFFTKVFENKGTNDNFTDEHDFWIVNKGYLEHIINHYKDKIKKYYNDMLNPFFGEKFNPSDFLNTVKSEYDDDMNRNVSFDFTKITQEETNALWKIFEHVKSMRTEWVQLTPFDLNEDAAITSSWKYEYAIFELIRIYKTFDWNNDLMIYYGY